MNGLRMMACDECGVVALMRPTRVLSESGSCIARCGGDMRPVVQILSRSNDGTSGTATNPWFDFGYVAAASPLSERSTHE